MSEENRPLSGEELDGLLNSVGAAGTPVSDTELDETLASILGSSSAGSVFEPAATAAGHRQKPVASPPIFSQNAVLPKVPQSPKSDSRPQTSPSSATDFTKTTAEKSGWTKAEASTAKEALPPQTRKPFSTSSQSQEQELQLDDNPLVNEDFRRFFTTSITPDALFSSKPNLEAPSASAAGAAFQPRGLSKTQSRVLPAEEIHAQPPVQQPVHEPRQTGGFSRWLKNFFTAEEEPDEEVEPGTENAAEESVEIVNGAESLLQKSEKSAAQAPQPADFSAAEAVESSDPKTLETPDEPDEAESTAVFQKMAASEKPQDGSTGIFDPIAQKQTEAQPKNEESGEAFAAESFVGADSGIDDYENPEQQPEVAANLQHMVQSLTLRAIILGVLVFNAFYFGLAALIPALPQPAGLVSSGTGGVFTLMVYLVSLLLAAALNLPTLINGVRGLWQAPSSDSFAALSCIGALVQNLALLIRADSFDPTVQTVFTTFALLALFTNTLGKRLLTRGVQKNFNRLTEGGLQYAVASLVQDRELVRRLTQGLGETEPYLMVSRPTGFYCGFLNQSFGARPGDARAQKLCWILMGAAALGGVLGAVLGSGFVLPFAGVLCIGCPLSMVLVSSVPSYFMNKSAAAIGTILPGAGALEDMGQANVVVVDSADLFPQGSVLLKGLKVFGEPRIDLAIVYAASVLVPHCPAMRGIFLNIIQDRTEMLCKLEQVTCEVGAGFEAWTQTKQLLVGNRSLMQRHGVKVPPEDYELRYTKDGRYCPVYLAVNGRLYAMFVVGYRADADVKEMMDEIYISGLSLLVKGEDFNLTAERINTIFGIPEGCIKVLNAEETVQLATHTSYCSRCTGAMVHASSFKGFIAGIRIAANASGMEKAAGTIQAVSVFITLLLVLVLTAAGGLGALSLPAVLLYQLAWMLVTLMLPAAKQY